MACWLSGNWNSATWKQGEQFTVRERRLEITFREHGAEACTRVQVAAGAGAGRRDQLPVHPLVTTVFRQLRAFRGHEPNQKAA